MPRRPFRIHFPILIAHAIQRKAGVDPVLLDAFTGSGALAGHTPNI
jgi:hypothetical protein